LSLVLRPFSLRTFRAINRWGANTWWGFTLRIAEWGYGTHIKLSGDPLPPREHTILLVNHQQMADITFLMYLGRAKQRLGDMKWFVKDIIKWVPGVGWGLLFLDSLFVKRDWAADRASIDRTFASIIRGRVPLWLMLFPEGTRITRSKLERSQAFARERGLPVLRHLLTPRTKGFAASVQGLRQHLHAVYDVTIAYPTGVPTLVQYIRGYGRIAHLHVRRFAIEQLPELEDELGAWLHQRWQRKDLQLEHFYAHGAFIDEEEERALPQAAGA
jgi:1-acyl-sn-glycerol-3-phosphate acyltransferase